MIILYKVSCPISKLVVVDSPTMLVQVENLPEFSAEVEERGREILEQEEVLERRDLLRDDGEEDEDLEVQVVIVIVI